MSWRFKVGLLLLLAATVIIEGYAIYAYAKVKEEKKLQYLCLIVQPVDFKPEKYWNLTDPDPYVLEAIHNPSVYTEPFYYEDSTFWYAADENQGPYGYFHYNGTYYKYDLDLINTLLIAYPLSNRPSEYWNLTNPNKYLLEAIENPGKIVIVSVNSTIIHELYSLPLEKPLCYNGAYYEVHLRDVLLKWPSRRNYMNLEVTTGMLGALWVAVGVVYIKKTKKYHNRGYSC